MLRQRTFLEEILRTDFIKLIKDTSAYQNKIKELNNRFNFSINKAADLIQIKKDLSECSEFELFCITFVISDQNVEKFFTKDEIEYYKDQRLSDNKVKFPIVLKRLNQITDSQWTGCITVRELMSFRESQIINYNKDTQRAMELVVDGSEEYFKISLNTASVNKIADLMSKGIYIPTPITLNLPEDADFTYDHETMTMRIDALSAFDLTDGYHRYIAMARNYDKDNEFDYNMELRLTAFSTSKAKQFIWQEEQKNKMKKLDVESLNQQKACNIICEKLNEDPGCNLQGLIQRIGGNVNQGELATLIEYFFFKNNKDNSRARILRLSRELKNKFNVVTEAYPDLLEKKISYEMLVIILYVFSKELDINDIPIAINTMFELTDDLVIKKADQGLTRKTINKLDKLFESV